MKTVKPGWSKERTTLSGLSLAIVLILGSIVVSFAKAQPGIGGQSLEVSPPSQEISVNPGQTIQVKSKIRNRTSAQVTINARLEDFIASGDAGQVALTDKGPWAVTNWATLSPTTFTLDPNETKEVVASVSIPSTGAAGGRYGSFVFAIAGKATPGNAALSQEIASLFLLDISGPKDENVTITSFTAPKFLEFGPVPFVLNYKNSGNVHLKTSGVIAVTDMFGRKVADVVQVGMNIFPGSERKVDVKWDTKMLAGKYTAFAIISTGGTKNKTITATTSFIVFPVRIAVVVVLVIALFYVLRKRILKAMGVLLGK